MTPTDSVEDQRIEHLNDAPVTGGSYVLYWMQQSQRAEYNPALDYALAQANQIERACLVVFVLNPKYPDAQRNHFKFMLEGLAETADRLADRGIKLVVRKGAPVEQVRRLGEDAALVVCDTGYLRHQVRWRKELARQLDRRVVAVEGDAVVPVSTVSDKAETAARTIRPKINRNRDAFIRRWTLITPIESSLPLKLTADVDLTRTDEILDGVPDAKGIRMADLFTGGRSQAQRRFKDFCRHRLNGYATNRNDPGDPSTSTLSPYLHFGQISPIEIAWRIQQSKAGSTEDKDAFLEELIVRRELAFNFVTFTNNYDSYQAMPEWARASLADHADDQRQHRYTRKQLERADTHDKYWNAAMREARLTGYMHNYMRMYWGKKIIEWTNTPAYAYATAMYLNNKYFLDGRDPSSYANVGWLFGLHDRGWPERDVFGKVRYMNDKGLERKFDIDAYVARIDALGDG